VAFNVTVAARDAFGNVATGYAGTVRFTSTDGAATLPANGALVAGTGTFSAILRTGGSYTITATDIAAGSITGPRMPSRFRASPSRSPRSTSAASRWEPRRPASR
jgi:hypothetical protein